VKHGLLRALYYACQGTPTLPRTNLASSLTNPGDSGLKEYESRTTGGKGKDITKADDDTDALNQNIRVYFPSLETVNRSKYGKMVCLISLQPPHEVSRR